MTEVRRGPTLWAMTDGTRKLVVVTGATRGLGRAMALGLARAGHLVAGCGRSAEGVAALAAELEPVGGRAAVVDVADDGAVRRWAEEVLAWGGPPDLLLNNAALMACPAPLWQVPAAEMDALLRVNVGGTAATIRAFLPAMIARGSGVVVNFSSGWGRSVSPEVAPYCATKWAVEGLTRALAEELPPGLAAISLNPGIIDTDMLRTCWGEDAAAYPTAEEWAVRAVPFLLGLGPEHNGEALTAPG